MPAIDPMTVFDAARSAGAREAMVTALGTEGLREKGAEILARAVFTARGTNAIYVSKLQDVIDQLTAGTISEGQARTALWEMTKATGYTPEGGFPDAPPGSVPPAVAGSIQDLSSFQRRDLIVSTQLDLMRGAGQQVRGHAPERLAEFPAFELVRLSPRRAPRNWGGGFSAPVKSRKVDPRSRWVIAGGNLYAGRMIALKGDPVWGELGSYGNFADALGVDHPPFAFRSGMGWKEIPREECEKLHVSGPGGETIDDWFAGSVVVMAGKLPLPAPKISMAGVRPALVKAFSKSTGAKPDAARPATFDYSDIMERELARRNASQALARQS